MVSFVTWCSGKNDSQNENNQSSGNAGNLFENNKLHDSVKRKSITDSIKQKRCCVLPHYSQTQMDNQGCHSHSPHDPTHTHPKNKDGPTDNAISSGATVYYMDTKAKIAPSPTK